MTSMNTIIILGLHEHIDQIFLFVCLFSFLYIYFFVLFGLLSFLLIIRFFFFLVCLTHLCVSKQLLNVFIATPDHRSDLLVGLFRRMGQRQYNHFRWKRGGVSVMCCYLHDANLVYVCFLFSFLHFILSFTCICIFFLSCGMCIDLLSP